MTVELAHGAVVASGKGCAQQRGTWGGSCSNLTALVTGDGSQPHSACTRRRARSTRPLYRAC